MSKPLPSQNTFAGLSPPWSLVSLDANFTNVWAAIDDIGTYSNTLTDTGAVNALVVTPAASITFALVTGISLDVTVGHTTTSTSVTLNANGTGAKTVLGNDGVAPAIGALQANGIYRFVYDGTNWRLQAPSTLNSLVIGAPTSGVPLTVNTVLATNVGISVTANYNSFAQINIRNTGSGTNTAASLDLQDTGSTGNISYNASTATAAVAGPTGGVDGNCLNLSTNSAVPIQFAPNGVVAMKISSGGDTTARGVAICKYKAAGTSRSSTTTVTNDPDLTYAIPATGNYFFQLILAVGNAGATGATPGFAFQINYSGTFDTGGWAAYGVSDAAFTISNVVNVTALSNLFGSNGNIGGGIFVIQGVLHATGTGTLALQWAQRNSSANAVTVQIGSFLSVTQLS